MASKVHIFLSLIVLFANGSEFLQYHNDGDNLWTFLQQIISEDTSTNKDTTVENDNTYQSAEKENDKLYDVIRNDLLETKKLHVEKEDTNIQNVSLLMRGVTPTKMDTYLCTGYKLPKSTSYIVGYNPSADMKLAHHMLMFACENLPSQKKTWNCGDMGGTCGSGRQSIVYAWGRNAPPLTMDPDVGMKVGGDTGFKYLTLQVHYLNVPTTKDYSGVKVTFDKTKKNKLAGIFFLGAGGPPILPHQKEFFMDMGCKYTEGPTFHPFRFRVHAHSLGRVISAYRIRDNVWTLIGRGDPLKPQAFYEVVNKNIDVKPGDTLVGRCTYNSESRDGKTYIGATHSDEMCNFYIMYYYDSTQPGRVTDRNCEYPEWSYFWKYPSDHTVV